jgi:hypothetical protein
MYRMHRLRDPLSIYTPHLPLFIRCKSFNPVHAFEPPPYPDDGKIRSPYQNTRRARARKMGISIEEYLRIYV